MLNEKMEGLGALGLNRETSRRGFLKLGACAALTTAMVGAFGTVVRANGLDESTAGLIILANAKGLIVANPTRCTGCRRCEGACTEYNEGVSSPTLARVHVARNLQFGPAGAREGGRLEGEYGDFLVVQDTCKQCPHPVPCATACPQGAIVADPTTGARIVDTTKCIGCGLCQGACPWEMIQVNPVTAKATKCFLCGKCVEACPTSALMMVPWVDQTKTIPPRQAALKVTVNSVAQDCAPCHVKQ